MAKELKLPVVNSADFARMFGVSRAAVTHWLKDGMPHKRVGKRTEIDLMLACPWVFEQRGTGGKPGSARERLAAEQADKFAIGNEQARGNLIIREHVEFLFQFSESSLAAQIDGLAGRMANELSGINDPAVIRTRLQSECRRIRASHADNLSKLAQSQAPVSDGCADSETPAKQNGKPVGRRKKKATKRKRRTRTVAK